MNIRAIPKYAGKIQMSLGVIYIKCNCAILFLDKYDGCLIMIENRISQLPPL